MQRSRNKSILLLAVGLLVLFLLANLILWFVPNHGAAYVKARLEIDAKNYQTALTAYSNLYGTLPVGNNSAVTAVLAGKNPDNLVFLGVTPSMTNELGEFLDPKRVPYDIEIATNTIRFNRLIQ